MSPPLLQIRTPPSPLSFSTHLQPDPTHHTFLTSTFTHLSITTPPPSTTIRMGGGPRTYPGGVSKWQWKRMQNKKAKQLLRARLARERQIYEMRKRAELSAAVSDLERPWEVVEKAPKLFSVSADEQVKYLADRFQKPGGFDLWTENDGPQLFESGGERLLPSARFFPKGVVHSIKPYGRGLGNEDIAVSGQDSGPGNGESLRLDGKSGNGGKEETCLDTGSKVFDMNLQDDGSYGVSGNDNEVAKIRRRPGRK